MDIIIGHWENNEIEYHFFYDNSFIIIWKIKNTNSSGKYYFVGNNIFFEYGTNYSMKWNGIIELLNDSSLHIRDTSNEIGKVDEFKRNISKTTILEKNVVYKTNIQSENVKEYPQILFSKSIISLLQKQKFPKPIKPTQIYRPIEENNDLYKFGLIIGGVLILILFAVAKVYFLASVGSILALIGFIWFATYPEGRKLDKETKVYLEKYKSYEIQLKKYNRQISIPENEYDNYIKRELLLNKFDAFDDVLFNLTDYKKGLSHNYFKTYLINKFGNGNNNSKGIVENVAYKKYDIINNPYITDFGYINSILKLVIVIEIDEPYSIKEKKPIHIDDSKRNDFFLKMNWIIIRFAEEQVVNNTNECCDLISRVISIFENLNEFNPTLSHKIPIIKKWNQITVKNLIDSRHRESYLKNIV
jgi:very-short-patch-repair endonuclease